MNNGYSCQTFYKLYKTPTKIVVRRLPPNFTLEIFKSQVRPLPSYNYIYLTKAEKYYGANAFCRVYINFLRGEDVFKFKEKFDDYVFIGPKGSEYRAVVEYAQYQKFPKALMRYKRDADSGTIFQDKYHRKFVASLECEGLGNVCRPEFNMEFKSDNCKESLTPLLKFLAERKRNGKKAKDEQRCQRKKSDGCIVFVNSSVKKNSRRVSN